jgi:hypothetical protein
MAAPRKKIETEAKAKSTVKKNSPPAGVVIDFSALGLDDLKLTPKEGRYVFFYTNPEYDTFQNKAKSAVKAGYKKESARIIACQLHTKAHVAEAIRRLMDPLKIDVMEEMQKIIRIRIARIHYVMSDYYKKMTVIEEDPDTKKEVSREYEVLKDLSELTPEQLLAVDAVDYKGMAGRKVYVMADREKSMSEMMALYYRLFNGPTGGVNEEGEETMEIIKERLTEKLIARKSKDEISKIAKFGGDSPNTALIQEL